MIKSLRAPKSFISNFKSKLLNSNPIESRWYKAPIYKYKLIKETETITVTGHGQEWSNGNAIIYEITNKEWARGTIYGTLGEENQAIKSPFGSNAFTNVIKEKGVLKISKEQIGTSEWDITVNVLEASITDVKREDDITY